MSNLPEQFVACAQFEDTIEHFGIAETPEMALDAFLKNGAMEAHCECHNIKQGQMVNIKVFTAIMRDSPEADPDLFDESWQWILGEQKLDIHAPYVTEEQG